MPVGSLACGDVTVSAIVDEPVFEIALGHLFPACDPAHIAGERWLDPLHVDLSRGMVQLGMHSWLLRTPALNILVDTCIGAHKERPAHTAWHRRNTDRLLTELAAQGVTQDEVDVVMCTHLHADHVGWNTRLVDGRWVPTFPNARYAMSGVELAYWQERQAAAGTPANHGALGDSVLPVVEAGQALFVGAGEQLAPGIEVVGLPGHTPDHLGLLLQRDGTRMLFCGDAIHSPVQLVRPEWASAFCSDAAQAVATRRAMLEAVAADGALIAPAHFRGQRAMRVARHGDAFRPA